MYLYPDNLRSRPVMWLWQLRDIGIVGVGLVISILAFTQTGFPMPLALTAAYAFLSIRFEDTSILDFIRYAGAYFAGRQEYDWRFTQEVDIE